MIGWESLASVIGLSAEQKRNLPMTNKAGHTLAKEQSRFCQLEEMSHHTFRISGQNSTVAWAQTSHFLPRWEPRMFTSLSPSDFSHAPTPSGLQEKQPKLCLAQRGKLWNNIHCPCSSSVSALRFHCPRGLLWRQCHYSGWSDHHCIFRNEHLTSWFFQFFVFVFVLLTGLGS